MELHPSRESAIGQHDVELHNQPNVGHLCAGARRNLHDRPAEHVSHELRPPDRRLVGWRRRENSREEVNFLKYDTYDGSQPPVDFGYAQREGTIATNAGLGVDGSSGATTLQWNLSGGGTEIVDGSNPVREGPHTVINTPEEIKTTGRSAYIGGYVYRGPIEELQGKYIYTDFAHGNVFALSDFDRDIPLSSYSGTNFNLVNGLAALGTRSTVATSDVNSLWQSLIIDPTDPTYTPAQGLTFGIGRVVSFAEDNAGNLYVIDFGGNRGDPGFNNDYPNAGVGEIFRLVPNSGGHRDRGPRNRRNDVLECNR